MIVNGLIFLFAPIRENNFFSYCLTIIERAEFGFGGKDNRIHKQVCVEFNNTSNYNDESYDQHGRYGSIVMSFRIPPQDGFLEILTEYDLFSVKVYHLISAYAFEYWLQEEMDDLIKAMDRCVSHRLGGGDCLTVYQFQYVNKFE